MAFIDTFRDAEQDLRNAKARLAEAQANRDEQGIFAASVELAGARIAFAILASADLLGPNEGAGAP